MEASLYVWPRFHVDYAEIVAKGYQPHPLVDATGVSPRESRRADHAEGKCS